jgi:hypothetical protein
MSNKKFPDEVTTAMELAEVAGWPVSNRNRKIIITVPGGEPLPDGEQSMPVAITIGHSPNAESLKVFRANCRTYGLYGQGPARTPAQTMRLHAEVEARGLKEADDINAKRKAYEKAEQAKRNAIELTRVKADAATQQGMTKPEETVMSEITTPGGLFPAFDPTLLGTKESAPFRLGTGMYYCIECWQHEKKSTFRAPQGLAAHRGVRHQMYPGDVQVRPETSRVTLPEDVQVAFDMLRSTVAEAMGDGSAVDLAAKDTELVALKQKLADAEGELERSVAQVDKDRADFDKRFLEAQTSADKKLVELEAELAAKHRAEKDAMLQRVLVTLKEILGVIENSTPIQAVGKVDEIVRKFLS